MKMIRTVQISLLTCSLFAGSAAGDGPSEAEVLETLHEAIELYQRSRFGALVVATDPFERFENLVGVPPMLYWSENEMFDVIFNVGDEAFEAELDRVGGAGQGPPRPGELPAFVQRVHDGERGGYDSSSCRSCHFSGGADGGGTLTQVGLFRGDGQFLSSAILRDAPHVMGLGYIELLAQEINLQLRDYRDFTIAAAQAEGGPYTIPVRIKGMEMGVLTATPDGEVDTSGLPGVSSDLVIRPFGHKGRHAKLTELADEAFQIHHGLQTESRIERHREEAEVHLGDGEIQFDPDGDGVSWEGSEAQAVLMATYMSLLGTPIIRPPQNPELLLIWAEGRALFEDVGCESCHRADLRIESYDAFLQPTVPSDWFLQFSLLEHGEDPKPRDLDFAPDENGQIVNGAPLFAFTDLQRHDMGPALADAVPEVLPLGGGEVAPNMWLTRSLWGLADTAPYLHDGRAPTVHDAILWHGGEAEASSTAYLELSEEEQGALRVFLMSLTREPNLLVE
ncbi:MAG: di-heme oxidoredictase family protein [Bradymonadia bacterium]